MIGTGEQRNHARSQFGRSDATERPQREEAQATIAILGLVELEIARQVLDPLRVAEVRHQRGHHQGQFDVPGRIQLTPGTAQARRKVRPDGPSLRRAARAGLAVLFDLPHQGERSLFALVLAPGQHPIEIRLDPRLGARDLPEQRKNQHQHSDDDRRNDNQRHPQILVGRLSSRSPRNGSFIVGRGGFRQLVHKTARSRGRTPGKDRGENSLTR